MTNHKPILFSGEMVRAILAGIKTQTRRVIKPQPKNRVIQSSIDGEWYDADGINPGVLLKSKYGKPGDILWVRETFRDCSKDSRKKRFEYRADESRIDADMHPVKWTSPLFMPREASRITLEILSTHAERLNDISEDDARAEGVRFRGMTRYENEASTLYADLWESINGHGSWRTNPIVWVIKFKRIAQ